MRFSETETRDLFAAGFLISLAFAILLSGGYRIFFSPSTSLFIAFPIAFITAGIGFLLHELMHKFVAQRYGFWAEFRAYYGGLWLALGLSLLGFIIAAPGAVYIHNRGRIITREQNGKISLAGPLTNIILAVVFLVPLLLTQSNALLAALLSYGLTINALLAAFNMIPIMPFDGAKIKAWSEPVYWTTVVVAVGMFIVSWII